MGNKIDRRTFMKTAVFVCGGVALVGAGKLTSSELKAEGRYLRLPGAVAEGKFLGTCIKCGQCVQVCPYDSVRLLDINTGVAMGTPVIIPEERGCYLCDLLPCVLSCPSGALNHDVSEAPDVMMGKAVVVSPETCFGMTEETVTEDQIARLISHGTKTPVEKELAEKLEGYIGKPCTICRDLCPYPDKTEAIGLTNGKQYIPEIKEKCVGCGVCVELCPAKKKVITIEVSINIGV